MTMDLLWYDFTFDVRGDLFTATYKIKLRRWEILSTKRFHEPQLFPDHIDTATLERAKELVARLVS